MPLKGLNYYAWVRSHTYNNFLFYLTCIGVYDMKKYSLICSIFRHKSSQFHTVIRIHFISLSYHILVVLPSYFISMEHMLILAFQGEVTDLRKVVVFHCLGRVIPDTLWCVYHSNFSAAVFNTSALGALVEYVTKTLVSSICTNNSSRNFKYTMYYTPFDDVEIVAIVSLANNFVPWLHLK